MTTTEATQTGAKPRNRSPRQPAGSGAKQKLDGQKQGADGAGKSGSAGAGTAGELRGGTKQVLIEVVAMPGRGGRPVGPEPYPFGDLAPAKKLDDGAIEGPSFFIPDADNPDAALASARKRHKDVFNFWSRKMTKKIDGVDVKGVRIWKAAD